jgi:hypothetical protein
MDTPNNDLTNNIYQSNNAIALKLKQLEKIQNTIHSEDQFGEQDHTLKYSILSLSITIIMFLLRCITKNKKLVKFLNKLYQFIKCINSSPSNIEKKLSISEPFTIKVVSNSVNTAKKNASITSEEYSE